MTSNTVQLPGWALMWVTAVLVFVALKFVTAIGEIRPIGLGYFVGWPGLDPRPFVCRGRTTRDQGGWRRGAMFACAGGALVLLASRIAPRHSDWLVALGIPMFLHFGVFDVLAWMWRRWGVGVRPIMERPLAARSLTEFWSRWNTAVRDVSYRFVFKPVRRWMGMGAGVMATFFVSGVVHDLVLSAPARGGYGRPTIYFLIQGVGMLTERRLKLGKISGYVWMLLVLVAPLPLLVHPALRANVLIPFANAVGRLLPC